MIRAVLPDGARFVSGSDDRSRRSPLDGALERTFLEVVESFARAFAALPDGVQAVA